MFYCEHLEPGGLFVSLYQMFEQSRKAAADFTVSDAGGDGVTGKTPPPTT